MIRALEWQFPVRSLLTLTELITHERNTLIMN